MAAISSSLRPSAARRASSSSATASATCRTTVPSTEISASTPIEALARALVDQDIDALAEHGACLRIGRKQPRQIADALFEPRLGALAQRALQHHDGNGDEAEPRDEGFDGGEAEAEIGRRGHAEAGNRDEGVDQTLHGCAVPAGLPDSP